MRKEISAENKNLSEDWWADDEQEPQPIDTVRLGTWAAMLAFCFTAWTLAAYYIIIPAVQAVWGWLA